MTLAFGFIPAFTRKDWYWGSVQLLLYVITLGYSNLYFMVAYNRLHIRRLVDQGYILSGAPSYLTAEEISAFAKCEVPRRKHLQTTYSSALTLKTQEFIRRWGGGTRAASRLQSR